MLITDVYKAYSRGNDQTFSDELIKLQEQLTNKAQTLGPAAVAIQLRDEQHLTRILNRIEADAMSTPALRVVFLAGFIRAYIDYLALIADAHEVDSANARLSADGDEHDQADSIRLTILKAAYAHAGARAKELVSVVARLCVVNESSVKFHLKKLVEMKLIERLELGPKAVSYRISPLGEAVLAHRSKPHELALFVIDEAAFDATLRAAIKNEINIAWLDETTTRRDQPDTRVITASNVLPFRKGATVEEASSMSHGLIKMFTQYQKIQRKENTA